MVTIEQGAMVPITTHIFHENIDVRGGRIILFIQGLTDYIKTFLVKF